MNIENNIPEYTVTEFNNALSDTINRAFDFIKIRGEISNLKFHQSGHIYFNLKDESSIINIVCWRANVSKLSFKPEEGAEVIATGKISTYAKSISVYQLNIENLELSGEGALLKLIEERKKRLMKKGFFDDDKKIQIPFLPNSIGVITSQTGSVIKDIIHRVRERFPVLIQLYPVHVQGQMAAKEIIEAINNFNNLDFLNPPEIIIIARGGGSKEDLMPFNDEELAEAVYNSKIPIISAIGHETDITIIDYVSDLRAPTPSAAAEICVPVRLDLINKLRILDNNFQNTIRKNLVYKKEIITQLSRLIQDPSKVIIFFYSRLENLISKKNNLIKDKVNYFKNKLINSSYLIKDPSYELKNKKILFKNLSNKLELLIDGIKKENINSFINLSRLLSSSSIDSTLKRGYSIIRKNNKIVTRSKYIKENDIVQIQFYKDSLKVKIKKT